MKEFSKEFSKVVVCSVLPVFAPTGCSEIVPFVPAVELSKSSGEPDFE